MKRTIAIIAASALVLTSAVALAGCGSEESSADTQATTVAAATEAQQSSEQTSGAAISAEDAVFTYNGVSVELNGSIDEAVAALGEPIDISSQLSCHGEGEDKTYTYGGFIVNSYPLNGEDRVLEIVINSDSIPTSKGVQVGDPVSKVTEAYGENYKKVGVYYAYDAGDGKSLQFLVENDTVTEIDYYYDV